MVGYKGTRDASGDMSAGSKETKDKSAAFAKGGSGKMFGAMSSAPSDPGVTAQTSAPPANNKFAVAGGSGKMFGPQAADPQRPGVTEHSAGTSQSWGIPKGYGKGHMAGHSGADPARPK